MESDRDAMGVENLETTNETDNKTEVGNKTHGKGDALEVISYKPGNVDNGQDITKEIRGAFGGPNRSSSFSDAFFG
jgi:hypothetical protein